MAADLLTAARAEALFISDVSAGADLSREDVSLAIRRSVRAFGGTRGCAAEVAANYGDRPETAAARMRWALAVVSRFF
jgi:hypothetical protein